jgi:hypothetical protein
VQPFWRALRQPQPRLSPDSGKGVPCGTAPLSQACHNKLTRPGAGVSQPGDRWKRTPAQMRGEIAMQTITSALVALLIIAGVGGAAQAFDAKTFYEQVDRNHN